MERRGEAKGKAVSPSTRRSQNRGSVSPGLGRLRHFVRNNRKARLTALFHHVDIALLRWSDLALKRDAAAGVDGLTWHAYGERLEENLADLHARVHRGAYRALPSRRRMIPKPDGSERPLGIASIEERLIEFGRHAAQRRKSRGLGKPETFTFLGFIHICGRSRIGKFLLWRKSRRDRMRAKLQAIQTDLQRKMHETIGAQGRWLRAVVRGYFNYHAVPTNSSALYAFRYHVLMLWHRALRRRSQKDRTTIATMQRLGDLWLPAPHILHPLPIHRFAVKHPRREPSA